MQARLALPLLLALPAAALAQQTQSALLHARVLTTGDQFGLSVAVSGDWAIVSAHAKTDPVIKGSVLFFQREPTGWVVRQEILNPIVDSGQLPVDLFGLDVAIEGPLALVGARLGGDNDEGMVLVYELQGSTWVEVDRLGPTEAQFKEFFGFSLAISGDRIAVGAPVETHPVHVQGAVYVFDRTPAGWVQVAKFLPPPNSLPFQYDPPSHFGFSVDVAGKWVVVGAPSGPNNGLGGAAFVYRKTVAGWSFHAALVDTVSPIDDDCTGEAVAISPDARTILVGEPQDTTFSPHPGSVLVFERGPGLPGKWALTAVLEASDGSVHKGIGDRFGGSVAIEGNFVVVGATHANGNVPWAGAGYLFERVAGVWVERERLFRSPPPASSTLLGSSVSLSGPFVLVGDPIDWVSTVQTGAAYVFEIGLGTPYCPAVANSTGSPASFAVIGSTDVTDEYLTLSVHDAPPRTFGLFFFGPDKVQLPLGDGTLCVGGQIERLSPVAATGDGGAAMHAVDFSDPTVSGSLLTGSTWNFQFWFRDQPGGPAGSNLSNAVEVGFQ